MPLEFEHDEETKANQRRLRIRLSVYAFSYEVKDISLIDDHEYDRLSYLVDTSIDTDNPLLDEFFRKEFSPYTGSWVRKHPELDKLEALWFMCHEGYARGDLIRFGNTIYYKVGDNGRKKN